MRICIYSGKGSFKDMMKYEDGGECYFDIACKNEIRDALLRAVKKLDSVTVNEKEEPNNP